MDVNFLAKSLPVLLNGALMTIFLSLVSLSFGSIVAVIIVVMRLLGGVIFRSISAIIVAIFRGTPLLVQLYLVYYGLPQFGIVLNSYVVATIVLSLYMGAYLSEALRGAIESIHYNQIEGAQALGLSRWQALRVVVLPQAVRLSIPPSANQFISMLKESSLVSQITIMELTLAATWIISWTFRAFETYLMAAAIYLLITTLFTALTGWLEKWTAIPGTEYKEVERPDIEINRAVHTA